MLLNNLEEIISLLIKLVYPLLLIFGSFGNIMVIIVFCRMKYYSAMSTYYIALALSDMVMLSFGWLTHYWIYYQFDVVFACLHALTCKLIYGADYISSTLSSWYLVVMTMQRAMSVVWPHRVNVVCTRNVSRVVTAVITVVIMASYSHIVFEVSIVVPSCNSSSCTCHCGAVSDEYSYFKSNIFSWIDLVVASVAPFSLLVVSNIVLVRAVFASTRNMRSRLSIGQSAHVTTRESKASSLTKTLIALSVTFIILTGPFRLYIILYPYLNPYGSNMQEDLIFYVLYLLCAANSAINFYLYCLTGTKFRSECANLLRSLWHKIQRSKR